MDDLSVTGQWNHPKFKWVRCVFPAPLSYRGFSSHGDDFQWVWPISLEVRDPWCPMVVPCWISAFWLVLLYLDKQTKWALQYILYKNVMSFYMDITWYKWAFIHWPCIYIYIHLCGIFSIYCESMLAPSRWGVRQTHRPRPRWRWDGMVERKYRGSRNKKDQTWWFMGWFNHEKSGTWGFQSHETAGYCITKVLWVLFKGNAMMKRGAPSFRNPARWCRWCPAVSEFPSSGPNWGRWLPFCRGRVQN